tara:strand:- start:5439 stop:6257 length:819 start_codon:yes stop_codon:yes gene_type:complete
MKTKFWRKYNRAIIPREAPHILVDSQNIISIIKCNKVLFARWVTNFDCKEKMNFWYIIKDNSSEISSYSTNTRNQIRKGLKNFKIRIVDKSEIMNKGYDIYKQAFKNYEGPKKIKDKNIFLLDLEDNFHFWGIYNKEKELIGYAQNRILNNSCDYSTIKVDPKYLRDYPYYALFYEMNRYYLSKMKLQYVSDGSRSILHQTNIQDFLVTKFKFRKAYCKLNIIYHPMIKPIVFFIYPLRKILQFFPFNFFYNLNKLLFQEEIRRHPLTEKRC